MRPRVDRSRARVSLAPLEKVFGCAHDRALSEVRVSSSSDNGSSNWLKDKVFTCGKAVRISV